MSKSQLNNVLKPKLTAADHRSLSGHLSAMRYGKAGQWYKFPCWAQNIFLLSLVSHSFLSFLNSHTGVGSDFTCNMSPRLLSPTLLRVCRRNYSTSRTVSLAFDLHEPANPSSNAPRAIVFMHGLFGSKKNNRSISK